MITYKEDGVTVTIDPTNKFRDVPSERLIQAVGVLPSWVLSWDFLIRDVKDSVPTWAEYANQVYAHGGGWQPFGEWELDEDGTLTYDPDAQPEDEPKDPPLPPLISLEITGGNKFYMYEHAWVCHKKPSGEFEVSRMD